MYYVFVLLLLLIPMAALFSGMYIIIILPIIMTIQIHDTCVHIHAFFTTQVRACARGPPGEMQQGNACLRIQSRLHGTNSQNSKLHGLCVVNTLRR
jgi:hypothetical protein